jgi:hypothetical protein
MIILLTVACVIASLVNDLLTDGIYGYLLV